MLCIPIGYVHTFTAQLSAQRWDKEVWPLGFKYDLCGVWLPEVESMITARGGSRISEGGRGRGGGAYIKCYALMYTCLTFFFLSGP